MESQFNMYSFYPKRIDGRIFQPDIQNSIVRKKIPENKTNADQKLLPTDDVKKTIRVTCQENFHDYLVNTTLHGLRYVGDRSITPFERCFFVVMFLLVFISSVYFITNVWLKWTATPMIITLSSFATPISDFPFPAVSICNMNQAKKSAVLRMPLDSMDYTMVESLCSKVPDGNATNPKSGKWLEFKRLLMKVSQPCKDMLVSCRYGGFEYDCMDLFQNILTDEGLCCIFNGVDKGLIMRAQFSSNMQALAGNDTLKIPPNDWTPERGYTAYELQHNRRGSPRPAAGTGSNMGLTLLLNVDEREYFCSSTNSYGFKLMLHSPNELPKISFLGNSLANGYETRIVVVPTISESSFSVRKVPRYIRQCLFESENPLQFYRTYSRRNCLQECEAKIFLSNCECILYHMPRYDDNITICGRSNNDCVKRVTELLKLKTDASFQCECMPGCFAINYDTETSMTKLLPVSPLLEQHHLDERNAAIVHIYYKDHSFRSQRKDELVGFTEFLSGVGGLLGLFMGFSMISISELFYFMSIRPCCNYLRLSEQRRRAFETVFHKVRALRYKKKKPSDASKKMAIKSIDSTIFPYID